MRIFVTSEPKQQNLGNDSAFPQRTSYRIDSYNCHSECSARAVHVAGGFNWMMQTGWNPGWNLVSLFKGRASWPFQIKLSRSQMRLASTLSKSNSRPSRSNCIIIICPAVPPTINISLNGHITIFWIASRGSSLKGS